MGEVDWQSATTLVLAGRQSMRRSGTIAQELLKVSPWMGEVDWQSAKIFMLAQRLNGAAFMDERTRIVESQPMDGRGGLAERKNLHARATPERSSVHGRTHK